MGAAEKQYCVNPSTGKRYMEDYWHAPIDQKAPVGLLDRLDPVARAAVVGDFMIGRFSVPPEVSLLALDDGIHCALVDAMDLESLARHTWSATRYHEDLFGYVNGRPAGEPLHRMLLNAKRGDILDHRNRLVLDNRRSNLRFADKWQNSWNVLRLKGAGSSSRFVGVTLTAHGWQASVRHMKEPALIGYFEDEVTAARAYDAKCKELRGEFAVLNFPEVANG